VNATTEADAQPPATHANPSSSGSDSPFHPARRACDAVFRKGGIMHGGPDGAAMVGEMRWIDANRIFWFAAHGDSRRDAYVLDFDEAIVERNSICFRRNGVVQRVFSVIAEAPIDDPEDYRIAWQLWQQISPLRAPFIERCYRALAHGADTA
jgi:hypothetical protein